MILNSIGFADMWYLKSFSMAYFAAIMDFTFYTLV